MMLTLKKEVERWTRKRQCPARSFNHQEVTLVQKVCNLYVGSKVKKAKPSLPTTLSFVSRKLKGKYNISICLGTACFVKGSQGILDRAIERLGIEEGDITPDGNFSIETVRCVGACGLAPVFMINKEVYGRSSIKDFDKILDEYVDMIYHENQA